MSDGQSRSFIHRFFRATLLVLGGVIAITLALELLAQIWGWLVLIAVLGLVGYVAFVTYHWWRDRQ